MEWIKENLKVIIIAFILMAVAWWFLLAPRPATAADLGGNCCADLEERIAELEATTARKGNRKVSLEISGEVNKALLYYNTSGDSDWAVIDNSTSESRVRFIGAAKISPSLSAGYILELHTGFTEKVPNPTSNDISVRRSAVWIDGTMGRLTIGQYDTATYGISEAVIANTDMAVRPLNFFGAGPTTYIANLVRYDSPEILTGLRFAASVVPNYDGDDTLSSFALKANGRAGEIRFLAAAGIDHMDGDTLYSFALGGLHEPSGLFLNANVVAEDGDKAWHLTGGLERRFSEIGRTTLYGEYLDADGGEETFWGFGVVQNIEGAAMDVYASYRKIDEADMGLLGSRIRF